MNVLDSINYIRTAWDKIKTSVMRKCLCKGEFSVLRNSDCTENLAVEDEDFVIAEFSWLCNNGQWQPNQQHSRYNDEVIIDATAVVNVKKEDDK